MCRPRIVTPSLCTLTTARRTPPRIPILDRSRALTWDPRPAAPRTSTSMLPSSAKASSQAVTSNTTSFSPVGALPRRFPSTAVGPVGAHALRRAVVARNHEPARIQLLPMVARTVLDHPRKRATRQRAPQIHAPTSTVDHMAHATAAHALALVVTLVPPAPHPRVEPLPAEVCRRGRMARAMVPQH
jgi:hypothetical protein